MSTFVLRTSSVGDLAIHDGYLLAPVRGTWLGTAECSGQAAPAAGEAVTLLVYPDARPGAQPVPDAFVGTVRRARVDPGSDLVAVSFVGGAGRMLLDLGPADHLGGVTPVPAGVIAARLASTAGERLAAGVEKALDAYTLPRWHRAGGMTARDALDLFVYELAEVTGEPFGWRMLPAGALWIGVETWPAGSSAATYTGQDGDDGTVTFRPDGAKLLPGTTAAGERAVEVVYSLATPRCEVRHAVAGDAPREPAGRALYAFTYNATVIAQRSDGTLDLSCEDDRIGDVLAVPFRVGMPGMRVSFDAGAVVRLGWASSSPRAPFAFAPDQDPAATHALALVGDGVSGGTLQVLMVGGVPQLVYTPPGGTAGLPASTVTLSGATITGPGHKYAKGVSA